MRQEVLLSKKHGTTLEKGDNLKEIGILLPNKKRWRRTLHIQKDALPYTLC